MKEELISFEAAKLAKKVGFNLYSPAWYGCDNPSGDFKPNRLFHRSYANWDEMGTEDDQEGSEIYSAPTLTQLQTWLREKHGIMVWVNPTYYDGWNFRCNVCLANGDYETVGHDVNDWNGVLEIGLIEALKTL